MKNIHSFFSVQSFHFIGHGTDGRWGEIVLERSSRGGRLNVGSLPTRWSNGLVEVMETRWVTLALNRSI